MLWFADLEVFFSTMVKSGEQWWLELVSQVAACLQQCRNVLLLLFSELTIAQVCLAAFPVEGKE